MTEKEVENRKRRDPFLKNCCGSCGEYGFEQYTCCRYCGGTESAADKKYLINIVKTKLGMCKPNYNKKLS